MGRRTRCASIRWPIFWLANVCIVLVLHILVDLYLAPFGFSAQIAAPWVAVLISAIAVVAYAFFTMRGGSLRSGSLAYWAVTWGLVGYLVATHVEGFVSGVISNGTLKTVTGMHLLRAVGVPFIAVYAGGLKPNKARCALLMPPCRGLLLKPTHPCPLATACS